MILIMGIYDQDIRSLSSVNRSCHRPKRQAMGYREPPFPLSPKDSMRPLMIHLFTSSKARGLWPSIACSVPPQSHPRGSPHRIGREEYVLQITLRPLLTAAPTSTQAAPAATRPYAASAASIHAPAAASHYTSRPSAAANLDYAHRPNSYPAASFPGRRTPGDLGKERD